MRLLFVASTILIIVQSRIYNGKSRHERQAPDEFENELRPNGESENFNPFEVVSIDGQSPIRYHHTECGTVLKEIAVLQPVNSDRDQFILKRILIEKDTGKPASGPCAEALQAMIDKEDADKPPFEPPERIDGGVEPRRNDGGSERNVIVDLPYMSAPEDPRGRDPYPIEQQPAPRPEYQQPEYRPYHHQRRNGTRQCGSRMKQNEIVPGPQEKRRPGKCIRKDNVKRDHPPIIIPPPPPVQVPTPEYKEFNRPLDIELPPIETRPVRKGNRCIHRAREDPPTPESIQVLPRRKPSKCRNKNSRGQGENGLLPLPQGHNDLHDHHGRLHHGHHHPQRPLDPIEREISNREPEIEVEDLVRREREPIPALPVYRM